MDNIIRVFVRRFKDAFGNNNNNKFCSSKYKSGKQCPPNSADLYRIEYILDYVLRLNLRKKLVPNSGRTQKCSF